jgi:hypothetical protein
MRRHPASFAFPLVVAACWFALSARPQAPAGDRTPLDPTAVAAIAGQISQRSEHLKPMFEEVHAADWVAKGASETYVSQWSSLTQQNDAIRSDMDAIAQRPEAMQDVMRALFRVHRFDGDLNALLNSVRRYQNPALADLIESVASGDQDSVEKLQQYVLDLANEKERQLDVEDKEAQRCRATLANQPVARPPAQRKTTGTPK